MLRRITYAAAVAALLVALPGAAQEGGDEFLLTLPEIMTGYYDAVGGEKTWEEVESFKMQGKMVMGPGMEAPFTIYQKRPEKMRLEFEVQGMTGIQAYNGETGWMFMPFMGKTAAEVMPDEMLDQFRQQADIEGPLLNYSQKGHEVELVGEEEMEGTPTYKLKVTLDTGEVRYFFLDKETFIPIAMTGSAEVQGQETSFEVFLSDYEVVGDGLVIPHSIEQRAAGTPAGQVITIESVEVDIDVEDELFEMPEDGEMEGEMEEEAAE